MSNTFSTTSSTFIEKRSIRVWLIIGLIMVFFQVVIGGVTRLTDSGLSITEWAVIQGTLPPLNEAEWEIAFEKYKDAAKKQYEALHADMTVSEFKVIYFWEYFHRLWARMMGFVFLFPFLYFLYKKWLPTWLLKRLGIVIFLAALAAVFGWIMVASGLHEDTRTWVSAYKLVTHLGIATVLFGYLFWTCLKASQRETKDFHLIGLRKMAWFIVFALGLQILLGGLMAGMRAGLIHPYISVFVEGERFYNALWADGGDLINYEPQQSIKAWVQLFHRGVAYLLTALIFWFYFNTKKQNISKNLSNGLNLLITMLIIQVFLGILTVINCIGRVPLFYGAVHQAVALLLLGSLLYVVYQFKNTSKLT